MVIRNTHFSLKGKAGKEKKAAECHFPDGPAFAITYVEEPGLGAGARKASVLYKGIATRLQSDGNKVERMTNARWL